MERSNVNLYANVVSIRTGYFTYEKYPLDCCVFQLRKGVNCVLLASEIHDRAFMSFERYSGSNPTGILPFHAEAKMEESYSPDLRHIKFQNSSPEIDREYDVVKIAVCKGHAEALSAILTESKNIPWVWEE